MNSRHKNKIFFLVFVSTLLFFGRAPISHSADATLFFSPASQNLDVGQSFSVGVFVSSPVQAMNAASATISFDQSLLSVQSISKSGTIISLWTREPSFANGSGSITFEGIVLNPGYQGSRGNLATIVFKTKAPGSASVRVVGGSVLANDGLGTNLVAGFGTSVFSVNPSSGQSQPPTNVGGVPASPVVSFASGSDQNQWYSNNNPKFSWSMPAGATGVNVLADHNPTTDPGTKSDGVFNSYTYQNVADGIWYFHIKLRNTDGWGPATHYKFQIDTSAPSLNTAQVLSSDTQKTVLQLSASDQMSQVERFEVTVDNARTENWQATEKGMYEISALEAGAHKVVVKAFDKAGNVIQKELQINTALAEGITPYQPKRTTFVAVLAASAWILAGLALAISLILFILKIISKLKNRRRSRRQFKNELRRTIDLLESAKRHRRLSGEEQEILYNLKKIYIVELGVRAPEENIRVIEGVFDGEKMVSFEGKVFSVPANYAAKSKMLEGDRLRLTITIDGSFIYKQTGPQERERKLAVLELGDKGEYRAITGDRIYRILSAAAVSAGAHPGDEIEILVPRGEDTTWAAVESVQRRAKEILDKKTAAKRKKKT